MAQILRTLLRPHLRRLGGPGIIVRHSLAVPFAPILNLAVVQRSIGTTLPSSKFDELEHSHRIHGPRQRLDAWQEPRELSRRAFLPTTGSERSAGRRNS